MVDRVPGTRHLTLRKRHALAVLAVVALCAVPAGDALAAGRGPGAKPAGRSAKAPKAKPAPKVKPSKISAMVDYEKESVRRGWAWGKTVRGQYVTVGKSGAVTTVSLQRGTVSSVTPTSIVVTSADGVSVTWTVTKGTAIVLPRARRARAAEDVTPTTSTTVSPTEPTSTSEPTSSTTSGANLTQGVTVGLRVRVWGYGADAPTARLIISDPSAPRPAPSSSPTSPSPTPTAAPSPTETTTPPSPTETTGPDLTEPEPTEPDPTELDPTETIVEG